MVIWRLPILQESVRYRRVVSCAHSKGRLVFPSGATCSISALKPQSLSCCTRTTLYQQSRWKSDSLTSQPSIEASVRLLELRQDGGEEQMRRCRRRSSSPRLKRSKARHSRFPPTNLDFSQTCLSQPVTNDGCPIARLSCEAVWLPGN